jgi:hypothetical protein
MPDVALADKVRPASGVGNAHEQYTFEAGERIDAGQVFRIDDTTGRAALADATAAATAGPHLFIAIDGARQAGNAVTGARKGLIEGFDLDAYGYNAPVYLSETPGAVADAAPATTGAVTHVIGRVMPVPVSGTPSAQDKLLKVSLPE